jgi:hypothetical protein
MPVFRCEFAKHLNQIAPMSRHHPDMVRFLERKDDIGKDKKQNLRIEHTAWEWNR